MKSIQSKLGKYVSFDFFACLLIVISGITIHTPVSNFKYVFLLCAIIISISMIYKGWRTNKLQELFKENKCLILLVIYAGVLVTVKRILILASATKELSFISGYGEIVCILFGAIVFYFLSNKQILLFMKAYVLAFTVLFLLFGKNTLYDYGDVLRAMGAYGNPNVFAFFACNSFFLSLCLAVKNVRWKRYVYIFTAAISIAAITNSTSRAMYLALVLAIFLAVFFLLINYKVFKCFFLPKLSKRIVVYIGFFLLISISAMVIYYPSVQNAVVNEKNQLLSEKLEDREELIQALDDKSIYERLYGDEGVAEGATFAGNKRFDIWKTYLSNIKSYLLFGNFEGSDTLYFPRYDMDYNAHNAFLAVLYKYGIFGVLLFLMILLIPFLRAYKGRGMNLIEFVIALNLCTLVMYGMLHCVENTGIFWATIGILYKSRKLEEAI